MCLGHPVSFSCVNIINSKVDELSTLGNRRTSLKCLRGLVITVPADALVPNGVRPSADTGLNEIRHFSDEVFFTIGFVSLCEMTSFKMADDTWSSSWVCRLAAIDDM